MRNFNEKPKITCTKTTGPYQSRMHLTPTENELDATALATATITVEDSQTATMAYRQLLRYQPYDQNSGDTQDCEPAYTTDVGKQLDKAMHMIGRAIQWPIQTKMLLDSARDTCMKLLNKSDNKNNPDKLNHYIQAASQFLFVMQQLIVRENNSIFRQQYIDYTIQQVKRFIMHVKTIRGHFPVTAKLQTKATDIWAQFQLKLYTQLYRK